MRTDYLSLVLTPLRIRSVLLEIGDLVPRIQEKQVNEHIKKLYFERKKTL
jgi:hypothetical protein